MEKKKNEDIIQKAKAPLADENHQLTPEEHNHSNKGDDEKLGKLPEDDFGTDHNSDPITAKNQ